MIKELHTQVKTSPEIIAYFIKGNGCESGL
jgi:hypothetical protein